MIPGMWLTEGGQSATGALIDHMLQSHARYAELASLAQARSTSVHALLNERLAELSRGSATPGDLTFELHVLPDHHGNRFPHGPVFARDDFGPEAVLLGAAMLAPAPPVASRA